MKKRTPYAHMLAGLDWLTMMGSFVAAIVLRGRSFGEGFFLIGYPVYGEVLFLASYSFVGLVVFQYMGLYRVSVFLTVLDHTVRLIKALAAVAVGIGLLAFFVRSEFIVDSRLALIYFVLITFSLMMVGRVIIFRSFYQFATQHRVFRRNALVVGANATGRNIAVNIFLNDHLGLNVVGFLDDELTLGKAVFNRVKVVGRIAEVQEVVKVFDVDEIILCLDNVEQTLFIDVLERSVSTGVRVNISSPLYDVIAARFDIEKYGNVPVVGISQVGPSPVYEIGKRLLDLALAAAGLMLLLPIFIVVSIAIKLTSRGPVFFSQERVGRDGKTFKFYKFRSMKVAEEDDKEREAKYAELIRGKWQGEDLGNPTKIVNQARITRIGSLLRKTSLDELPQLLNVLRGDMSLVGPRPCLPYEWKHYEDWHKRRLSVMPGCTGMWQVLGRSQVGFQDMVILDLFYSQNASFSLDLWLLVKTIPVMALGKGGK
jgi:exopolysaccharide biosynthesis polyprenyl glycosylphosphotransferase